MEEKKREFKAVAMRFTQEEFDKMDKSGMDIHDIIDFDKNPFLVNDYLNKELLVTNVAAHNKVSCRTIIETCDPKLFRQFCGLENSIEDELEAKMIPFELNPVFTPLTINLLKYADEQKKIRDESKDSTSNNKREFRAIAMRCSQEDFDKMDRTGLDFIHIGNFLHQNYLVNDYHEKQRLVSNVMHVGDCSVLEFWNEDIFRICCGLEPKSKKEVIFNLKVKDNLSNKVGGIKERIEQFKKTNQFHSITFGSYYSHFLEEFSSQLREKEMSDEMKHATNLEAGIRTNFYKPIEADNEPKTFKAKDIEYLSLSGNGKWDSLDSIIASTTLRFKPKPTPEESLSAEIESLSEKAKGLGLKATVLFEKS